MSEVFSGCLRARPEVECLKAYSAPLEGRRGLLRLDFNENTVGPSPQVVEAIRAIPADQYAVYPEYDGLGEVEEEEEDDEEEEEDDSSRAAVVAVAVGVVVAAAVAGEGPGSEAAARAHSSPPSRCAASCWIRHPGWRRADGGCWGCGCCCFTRFTLIFFFIKNCHKLFYTCLNSINVLRV